MEKLDGKKAIRIGLGLGAAALIGAAAYGVLRLVRGAADEADEPRPTEEEPEIEIEIVLPDEETTDA